MTEETIPPIFAQFDTKDGGTEILVENGDDRGTVGVYFWDPKKEEGCQVARHAWFLTPDEADALGLSLIRAAHDLIPRNPEYKSST